MDFNIAITEEGRWAVISQTLYRVGKKRLFKYTQGFRRQSLVRASGVITVSITGEGDEPEEEAEPAYMSREVTPEQLKKEEEARNRRGGRASEPEDKYSNPDSERRMEMGGEPGEHAIDQE